MHVDTGAFISTGWTGRLPSQRLNSPHTPPPCAGGACFSFTRYLIGPDPVTFCPSGRWKLFSHCYFDLYVLPSCTDHQFSGFVFCFFDNVHFLFCQLSVHILVHFSVGLSVSLFKDQGYQFFYHYVMLN